MVSADTPSSSASGRNWMRCLQTGSTMACTWSGVIASDPPRQLSWNWREAGEPAGTVSFTLTPSDSGGTLLRLVHVRQARMTMQAVNGNAPTMLLAA